MKKTILCLPGRKRKIVINWEIGFDMCTLLYKIDEE